MVFSATKLPDFYATNFSKKGGDCEITSRKWKVFIKHSENVVVFQIVKLKLQKMEQSKSEEKLRWAIDMVNTIPKFSGQEEEIQIEEFVGHYEITQILLDRLMMNKEKLKTSVSSPEECL